MLVPDASGISHLAAASPAINSSVGSFGVTDDMDGQQRVGVADVGADQYSTAPVIRRPLTPADVGPGAGL
jgi:poly(beta-D-mannuronate) lyase